MKTTLIAILIMLSGTLTVNAQMDKQIKKKSMEQKEMMMSGKQQGMTGVMGSGMMPMMHQRMMMHMQDNMMMQEMPMFRFRMMIRMLPNMQDRLSLTADQTKQLINLEADFRKQKVDLWTELSKKQTELKDLLKNEAPSSEVQAQLQKCADIRVKMHITAYETAMKMRKVLNDEQLEKACKIIDNNSNEMMPGMMMPGMMNQ